MRDTTNSGFTVHTPSGYLNIKADYARVRMNGSLVFTVSDGFWNREVACFAVGAWNAFHLVEGYAGGRSVNPERVAAALMPVKP